MNIYRRIAAVLLILVLAVSLSGCLQLDIDLGVDNNHTAYLTYHLKADLTDLDPDLKSTLNMSIKEFVTHCDFKKGFDVDYDNSQLGPDLYDVVIRRTMSSDNDQDAFFLLKSMLTDETLTPFMKVDMASDVSDYQELYLIDASLDFSKIIDASNLKSLPPALQDEINIALQSLTGTITIELPGTEVDNFSNETVKSGTRTRMQVPMKFSEEVRFSLTTRSSVGALGFEGSSIDGINQTFNLFGIAGWVLLAAGITMAVIGTLLIVRAKKNSKPE